MEKMRYSHYLTGSIVKVEIRDETRRIIYRAKFDIKNKEALLNVIKTLESYSGFYIIDLIYEKMKGGTWW